MALTRSTPALNRTVARTSPVDEPALAVHFDLPERVLQFGTGAFLRGFADYFFDEANRKGLFDGRAVMVGSTGSGRAARLSEQEGIYTLCVQGIEAGARVDRCRTVASVSRALASSERWEDVLALARSPELRFVVSNTTEVGIVHDPEDRLDLGPPRSFPGKLAAVLHERARAFDYDPARGLIVLPCELVERNGDELRRIVLALGAQWGLGDRFAAWVRSANRFCNTLVDRIVPGTPGGEALEALYRRLGYRDELLIQAEPYRLWAIEGDEALRQALPFAAADPGIVVAEDIEPYRERKVRILNGTHTIMVPLAYLCGRETVQEAVEDPLTGAFVRHVMLEEIVPSLDTDAAAARAFAAEVLDRFANPYIRHELLSITFQQTTKMRVRVVPSLVGHVRKTGRLPSGIPLGFAAYLWLLGGAQDAPAGRRPQDDRAEVVRGHRAAAGEDDLGGFVRRVCADEGLWGTDLGALPGFTDAVATHLARIASDGAAAALTAWRADHPIPRP